MMGKALRLPLVFVFLMWLVQIFQATSGHDLGVFGIYPRDTHSLLGIITSPLVHGNWAHLLSNTIPMLILGSLLFLTYDTIAIKVWWLNYFLTEILVWCFARESYHIGASGIIYGLASFLLFSGFFRMDMKAIAIAIGVSAFYGGMVWGVLPLQPGVSWESHLFGGIVGIVLAFIFRNHQKDETIVAHEKEVVERRTFDDFIKP